MQERIDCTTIDSEFKLSEAISSLKFYWNLAKHRGTPMTYELWSERGAIVPPMEVRHEAPQNGKALQAQEAEV